MDWITETAALEALYGTPAAAATRKVAARLTPAYRRWIDASRFCILSTVGPEGTDASPRGDDGPVVRVLDAETLALPDWKGNDRIDSLRNVVRDPRVSLLFMVPGSGNVVRVNGMGRITADEQARASFRDEGVRGGRLPRTVLVIHVREVYFQCARAIMRSRLWAGEDASAALPTPGEILSGMTAGEVGGATYDREWPQRALDTLW